MTILFCHGLESGPLGRKVQYMRDHGQRVHSPDCQGQDLSSRIAILHRAIVDHRPDIVVGSSFGGIAGLCAAIEAQASDTPIQGLLLCAPALQLDPPAGFTHPLKPPAPTIILHGTRDDVIDIEHSRRFAQAHAVKLIEVDDDHSLAASLPRMMELIEELSPSSA